MSANADAAVAMFKEGYNCSQSVLAACGRQFGVTRDQACHLGQVFGGGMCGLDQACGAVTGAFMAIGLKYAKTGADDAPKIKAHRLAQEFAERFASHHGSLSCTQLLGHNLRVPGERERVQALGLFQTLCPRLVRDAVEIVDDLLEKE